MNLEPWNSVLVGKQKIRHTVARSFVTLLKYNLTTNQPWLRFTIIDFVGKITINCTCSSGVPVRHDVL